MMFGKTILNHLMILLTYHPKKREKKLHIINQKQNKQVINQTAQSTNSTDRISV